ncbi:hypothetical protein HN587_07645 [Candidatus Woesearchaeota archaeon]|jgi:hypothetical protein|nr:hypothetical protein [Candidatus Woesearchaeota archaeon]
MSHKNMREKINLYKQKGSLQYINNMESQKELEQAGEIIKNGKIIGLWIFGS